MREGTFCGEKPLQIGQLQLQFLRDDRMVARNEDRPILDQLGAGAGCTRRETLHEPRIDPMERKRREGVLGEPSLGERAGDEMRNFVDGAIVRLFTLSVTCCIGNASSISLRILFPRTTCVFLLPFHASRPSRSPSVC